MGNITLRRGTETPAMLPERDPFRLVRDLLGWEPFREVMPAWRAEPPMFAPAFEVKETKDAYQFLADLPGVKEADVEISLTGNRLAITGKRDLEAEDKGEAYFVYERTYGAFTRTFTLPDGADGEHVQARMENGVLMIVLPKKPEVQAKRIAIGVDKHKA